MKIEILYFDGCPSWQSGLENLRTALEEEGLTAEIDLIRIEDNENAARKKFLGSPSFRIDGQDLWPEERQGYNLGCRVYATENGLRGFPTVAMLRERIRSRRSD